MDSEYYPFDIKSKRMMMKIDINAFFKLGDAFFEIHEMEDASVKVYWRKGLPERQYFDYVVLIEKKHFCDNKLLIRELILTEEYKKEMAVISPIKEVLLSDEELKRIIELVKIGIPDDYKNICGRDGHSFDIWFENSKRYGLWCWVHESLEPIADVINLLIERAGLDREMYGMKVQK